MKRLVVLVFVVCVGIVGVGQSSGQSVPNGTLAFGVVDYANGGYQGLYLMDVPGGTAREIPLPMRNVVWPHWSPDGGWIAFGGGLDDQIYVVKPDVSGLRRVTDGSGAYYEPSFSPDGNRLAFAAQAGHLFTVNVDGTNLTDVGVRASHPEWSPDGTKIAYSNWAQEGGYNSDLFVYDVTTRTETQITHRAPGEAFNLVAWSPDSRQLAVAKLGADGDWDIWKMDGDGQNQVNLTPDITDSSDYPGWWSSDGRWIFYNHADPATGNGDIWAMHPDGSGRVNLTNSPLVSESTFSFLLTPVPEPSTLTMLSLLAVSGVAAGCWRRRKRGLQAER